MGSIEDVILDRDRRGMTALRGHLAPEFCREAAQFILERSGTALIGTGFYILGTDAPETDGPPGAIALGRALGALGYHVVYVSDGYTVPLLAAVAGREASVVEFPIADDADSEAFARDLLEQLRPSLVIAVERCGHTSNGAYLNMW
ncbi:MAG: glutamate cyclase domain-containing protein, partial [Dehalococcoidia bacterium]